MRAYIEHHAGATRSQLCPVSQEHASRRRASRQAPGPSRFPELGTLDEAWLWPTNGGWGSATALGYHGGYAFNSWLYAGGWPADWADEARLQGRERHPSSS
jgi:hypothetical protein